jgi:hypothetical protein
MKKTAVYKWISRFSEERGSVTDEQRSGRPAASRTEENSTKIRQIVRENRRLTVRSIAQQANIDREKVRKMRIFFVPYLYILHMDMTNVVKKETWQHHEESVKYILAAVDMEISHSQSLNMM